MKLRWTKCSLDVTGRDDESLLLMCKMLQGIMDGVCLASPCPGTWIDIVLGNQKFRISSCYSDMFAKLR